jgi:hypothetical protein
MGRAYCNYGRVEKCITEFYSEILKVRKHPEATVHRKKDNIKINLKITGYDKGKDFTEQLTYCWLITNYSALQNHFLFAYSVAFTTWR